MTATAWIACACALCAADLYVDPLNGHDQADGSSRPVKTIAAAIRLAQPGDTIHLQPNAVYRDWAPFFDKSGEPGKPITLDGHGATLDGCDPLTPAGWINLGAGLYRHDDLLPLTDAIVDRWFFDWDGRLNRMNRCSKGPSDELKSPSDLDSGEWTFVKDEARSHVARPGYIHGAFFIKLPAGQALADAKIEIPYRPAGVLIHGASRHLHVRNITATRPYNDGFNLSDCQDVVFENVRAIHCGDDGMSAHGACRYSVDGFVSIGNATGICDTGDSVTSYRNVYVDRCIGFDLYFLDTGRYSLTNAWIRSTAVRPLVLQGRELPADPCHVTLHNVLMERTETKGEVRVNPNCRLDATQCTFTGLNLRTVAGTTCFDRCRWDDSSTTTAASGVDRASLPHPVHVER